MSLPASARHRWGLDEGGAVGYLDLGDAVVLVPGGVDQLRALLDAFSDDIWEPETASMTPTSPISDPNGRRPTPRRHPARSPAVEPQCEGLHDRLLVREALPSRAQRDRAAAVHLDAHVHLSASSPKLEAALEAEALTVTVTVTVTVG